MKNTYRIEPMALYGYIGGHSFLITTLAALALHFNGLTSVSTAMASAFVISLLYRQITKKNDEIFLNVNGITVLIHNMTQYELDNIYKTIDLNYKVIIHCPDNKVLRMALSNYVALHHGFCEFVDSETLDIDKKEFDKQMWVWVEERNNQNLEVTVRDMTSRGWEISGETTVKDDKYCQKMSYIPYDLRPIPTDRKII